MDGSGSKKFRFSKDYRKLNNHIKVPITKWNEILDSLFGSVYFSHLDLHQGYYNVELDEAATAFHFGQFQITSMPMGLQNKSKFL